MSAVTRREKRVISMTGLDRRRVGANLAVATFCSVLLTGLLAFGRGSVASADMPHTAGVTWTAVDATTGQPVSRDEWISRALAAEPR